jgi:hypothetical protein
VRTSQTDTCNKVAVLADEVFDVRLIKTRLASFSNNQRSLIFLAVASVSDCVVRLTPSELTSLC